MSDSVTRQDTFKRTKIGEKCQIQKFKWDIFSNFQTLCVVIVESNILEDKLPFETFFLYFKFKSTYSHL